ncbi:hypothetical protein [Teredinibacter sp. KSP-S5-2]|uniref:hypothetical protein n=1 Tax=Teredinibacter sp. KSP-S5-2 TaxID=3034506 RepID=UPI0029344242|nr:hypothetical protein [Teredinibacter sp. KSP-S5-2]WNO11084.1 hypothetical protein P5V12_07860 [Teredinibacter sp. KSP-S5-2]
MENGKPNKNDLLLELEAIHESLINGSIFSDPNKTLIRDAIPDNSDQAEKKPNFITNKDLGTQSMPRTQPPKVLPGQRSLFEEASATLDNISEDDLDYEITIDGKEDDSEIKLEPKVELTPKSENPFLPASIRQKLNQHRSKLVNDLNMVGETLSRSVEDSKTLLKSSQAIHQKQLAQSASQQNNNSNEELVDKLVKQFLPQIEQELRKELSKRLTQKK